MTNSAGTSAQNLRIHGNLLSRNIYCQNSGVTLGILEVTIVEGGIPYLQTHSESIFHHPFYHTSPEVLLKKLEESLRELAENGYVVPAPRRSRIQLLVSALMFSLGAIKQHEPTLPSFPVAIGTSHRLYSLARWYHLQSSKRIQFPLYSVSKVNQNLEWENYRDWMDDAFRVKEEWENTKRTRKLEEEKKLAAEAIKEIRAEDIYTKLDMKKIWNWIDLQLEHGGVSKGQRQTLSNLFIEGPLSPEFWTMDDLDDLREAIYLHCDTSSDIMFFIKKRIQATRLILKDFYSGFTLLGSVAEDAENKQGKQTAEEQRFMDEYDKRVEILEALPSAPKRDEFSSFALFIQAQANWNILKKRWDLIKKAKPTDGIVPTDGAQDSGSGSGSGSGSDSDSPTDGEL